MFLLQKINLVFLLKLKAGLPHTQGTQGNSGNFDLFFKLREVLIFSKKFREVLRFLKSRKIFDIFRMRFINLVQYLLKKNNFI